MTVKYFLPPPKGVGGGARPVAQEAMPDVAAHLRNLAQVLNTTVTGQDNSSFQLTLDAGATSTKIVDTRMSLQTCISFMPTTADAAAISSSIWVQFIPNLNGRQVDAVVNHSAAGADCVFTCSIAG